MWTLFNTTKITTVDFLTLLFFGSWTFDICLIKNLENMISRGKFERDPNCMNNKLYLKSNGKRNIINKTIICFDGVFSKDITNKQKKTKGSGSIGLTNVFNVWPSHMWLFNFFQFHLWMFYNFLLIFLLFLTF